MGVPYIGEIRMFAGSYAPAGWAFCEGQLLPISEYDALFALIGTTYGGDGQSTFGLPDLRGRAPVHVGSGFVLGQAGGQERVTLTTAQLPAHGYPAADVAATSNRPGSGPVPLASARGGNYAAGPADGSAVGGSQPHENRSPYLGINYIMSLFGVFPSAG